SQERNCGMPCAQAYLRGVVFFTASSPPRLSTVPTVLRSPRGNGRQSDPVQPSSSVPPLRQLSALDSPMGGALMAGTPPRVRTVAAAWDDNPGWQASPDSHVLAPLDAGFDEQGACVFIPHCPSRLLAALETRPA